MTTCKKCVKTSEQTAKVLSLCAKCIREADRKCLMELKDIHAASRGKFGLLGLPPSSSDGIQCNLCQNNCWIPVAGRGYCGARRNEKGHLMGGTPKEAVVHGIMIPFQQTV